MISEGIIFYNSRKQDEVGNAVRNMKISADRVAHGMDIVKSCPCKRDTHEDAALAALTALIPNCTSSVILAQLYLRWTVSFTPALSVS